MTLCGPTAKPRPSTSSLLWLYLCCDEDDGILVYVFFFSSRRRHTRWNCDWSSDVCYSDLGGPHFKFNEAVSFMVKCETQAEVDLYWNVLTAGGGQESQCGWLKDKYGLSWQIVPTALGKYITDRDGTKAKRAMQAMMKMKKIDIAALQAAHAG